MNRFKLFEDFVNEGREDDEPLTISNQDDYEQPKKEEEEEEEEEENYKGYKRRRTPLSYWHEQVSDSNRRGRGYDKY